MSVLLSIKSRLGEINPEFRVLEAALERVPGGAKGDPGRTRPYDE